MKLTAPSPVCPPLLCGPASYWVFQSYGWVLDMIPERSVPIFVRISRANSGIYDPLPGWEALISDPVPKLITNSGYDYVYMDRVWWDNLTPAQQANFQQPCIDIVD